LLFRGSMAGLPVSPVNAWSYASRHNPHDSGPKRIAISISYRTFIDYLLPVYPGASQTTVSQVGRMGKAQGAHPLPAETNGQGPGAAESSWDACRGTFVHPTTGCSRG